MKAYTKQFPNKFHIIMNNKEILQKNLEYAKISSLPDHANFVWEMLALIKVSIL
jgi:hypothetical protein